MMVREARGFTRELSHDFDTGKINALHQLQPRNSDARVLS